MLLVKCQNNFCFHHLGNSSWWNLVTISIEVRRIYTFIFLKELPHLILMVKELGKRTCSLVFSGRQAGDLVIE